jgi:hypothetical protein
MHLPSFTHSIGFVRFEFMKSILQQLLWISHINSCSIKTLGYTPKVFLLEFTKSLLGRRDIVAIPEALAHFLGPGHEIIQGQLILADLFED